MLGHMLRCVASAQAAVDETIESWENLVRAAERDEEATIQLNKRAAALETSLISLRYPF